VPMVLAFVLAEIDSKRFRHAISPTQNAWPPVVVDPIDPASARLHLAIYALRQVTTAICWKEP
jgi:hypothetical protein